MPKNKHLQYLWGQGKGIIPVHIIVQPFQINRQTKYNCKCTDTEKLSKLF